MSAGDPGLPVVRSRPGPRPTPAEAAAVGQQPDGKAMLERVRKAASDWRNAQTALLGLITVVGVLKGPDSVAALNGGARMWVGALLFAALVLAAGGTYIVAEVAYGLPRAYRRFRTSGGQAAPVDQAPDDTLLAIRGARNLRLGLLATFGALALMTAAIGVTWYVVPG